jgi:hypothetical protein
MSDEKIFAEGFIFRKPNDSAPDWVLGRLSVKVDDAIAFLKEREDGGWVNLEIKESSSGKTYVELNTWKPDRKRSSASTESSKQEDDDGYGF